MTGAAIQDEGEGFLTPGRGVSPAWRVVLTAVLGLALGPSVILLMSFGVFAPQLGRAFGWSIGAISLGAMIISLMVAVVSPLQGWLADRFGARRVMLACLPLFAIGLGLLSTLQGDIRIFYLACALLPVAAVGVWPLSFMKAVSTWFDRRLGFALGATNVGAGLGGALVPILVGAVLAFGTWRTAYLTLAGLSLLVVLPLTFLFFKEAPPRAESGQARAAPGLSLREVLRDGGFWRLTFAFMALGVLSSGLLIHQVNILIDHGLAQSNAILLQSVLGLSSIAGRLVAGWTLDRVHVSWFMPAVMTAAALACGLYAAAAPPDALLVVAALVIGFVIGAEFDVLGFAIRRYYGLRTFGIVFGLIFASFQIGAAVGTAGMGILREQTGSFSGALIGLAVLSLLAGAAFINLGPYRFRPQPRESIEGRAVGTGTLTPAASA